MRNTINMLFAVCLCAAFHGAAAETPDAPPASNTPTTDTAAPAATNEQPTASEAAATAKAEATAAEQAKEAKDQEKRLRTAGYRPEVHDGVTVYCRKEASMGTRFETKKCGTAKDLDFASRQGQEMLRYMQRDYRNPPGSG